MRLLHQLDPRWAALLLVPVLVAAGAAQPDELARASTGAVQLPDVLPSPAPGPTPAAVSPARPALPQAVGGQAARTHGLRAARTSLRHRGPLSIERRGDDAVRTLGYLPARLGYRIRFLPYDGGALGTTNRETRLITIYVSRRQSELVLRTTLAHELGHVLDFEHGTPERRDAYRRIRRLPPGPWFPCDRCDDLASPAGDFAEVFALWLAGPGDFRSRLQWAPDPAQLRELEPLFRVPQKPVGARPAPKPSAQPQKTPKPATGLPALLGPAASPSPGRL